MKSIEYRRSWSANTTAAEEMAEKFGLLLRDEDTSPDWEKEESVLYRDSDGSFNWLDANGCSCWDGDWDGWNLSAQELIDLAHKIINRSHAGREKANELIADWVIKNEFSIRGL